jgi:hypothetical protein
MTAEFRLVASRLVHENFGPALGDELRHLGLLPYHVALYDSYRKYRTHNWALALRLAMGAVLHKHRAIMDRSDNYSSATLRDPAAMLGALADELRDASYPPAPLDAVTALRTLPQSLEALLATNNVQEAAEVAGHAYAKVDAVLPGVFEMSAARRITDRLVQPRVLEFGRAMSWAKMQYNDTLRKRDAEAELRTLLRARPDLVRAFGQPRYMEDDDRYWRWWEFAVFDDARWHTFHLDDRFDLSLESGGGVDNAVNQREQVAELIVAEFTRAAQKTGST